MAYKLEDLARNSPRLPGDLDRTKRRTRAVLSPDRQKELISILDQHDKTQIAAQNTIGLTVVARVIEGERKPEAQDEKSRR